MKLQVEYVPIGTIKPYKRNAKLHPQEQIEQIKNSMQEFGNIDPIGVWHNEIVEGHGRFEALKQMGAKEIPIIRLDDLTDEQRKAYALAHNKLTMNSDFDVALLDTELAEIETIDMTLLGFDDIRQKKTQEVVEDDFDDDTPADTEPVAQYGDIYKLGRHRLMCGDATRAEDIDTLMGGCTADLCLHDPPYGINIVKNSNRINSDKVVPKFGVVGVSVMCKARKYREIANDDNTDCARDNYQIIKTRSKNQIIFGGNYFTDFLPPKGCWCVWDKKVPKGMSFADVELAWTSFDTGSKIYPFMWTGMKREGSRDVELKERIHPTQKPVGMLGDILKDFSKENDLIIDCFGGSGSTLIACEQLGRTCYMMELEPKYVDVIIRRWLAFTGGEAEYLGNYSDKIAK